MALLHLILTKMVKKFFNDYGRTKYFAEKVYRKWHEEDPQNRKLVIIRPTVVFGEGNEMFIIY